MVDKEIADNGRRGQKETGKTEISSHGDTVSVVTNTLERTRVRREWAIIAADYIGRDHA